MMTQKDGRPQAVARQGTFANALLGGSEHVQSTASHASAQAEPRLRRIYDRAANVAYAESLKDAKRALKAISPEEKAALRQSAAILFAFSRHLQEGAR